MSRGVFCGAWIRFIGPSTPKQKAVGRRIRDRRPLQSKFAAEAAAASEMAAQRMAEEDPLNGPPRTPRAVAGYNEDPSSLDRWLDGGSVVTGTTGTTNASRFSRGLSELTKTSIASNSICSEPGTTHQMQFRHHRRAFALGKVNFKDANNPFEAGNLKDGVPNIGWPDRERLMTNYKDNFGSRQENPNISKDMYASVIQSNQHPFIERFLDGAETQKKDVFMGMVRSLEYLRTAKDMQNKTQMANDLNLEENRRLFRPGRAKPWFEKEQANISMIPIGTLNKNAPPKPKETEQPPPPQGRHPPAPPSPAVSGLSSMPLSRLSTPLVGGRGLPFASPPPAADPLGATV